MQQVARYEGIGELHTEVESFVQQVARYDSDFVCSVDTNRGDVPDVARAL